MLHLKQDRSHIVRCASGQRNVQQSPAAVLRRAAVEDLIEKFLIGDHVAQAIGAEDQSVTRLHRLAEEIGTKLGE